MIGGKRHEGFWREGKQDGKGTLYLADGTVKTGIWLQGRRLIFDKKES